MLTNRDISQKFTVYAELLGLHGGDSLMISINPDAHSIGEIDNIKWGVTAARKGGLTKAMTWNARPLSWIEDWLITKSARQSSHRRRRNPV